MEINLPPPPPAATEMIAALEQLQYLVEFIAHLDELKVAPTKPPELCADLEQLLSNVFHLGCIFQAWILSFLSFGRFLGDR